MEEDTLDSASVMGHVFFRVDGYAGIQSTMGLLTDLGLASDDGFPGHGL